MSLTLGEKLRQAREERGITLSEVAEQTRISPLYLESIENDDYRNLPGGIFNKGFVKSFAKYVGLNEQEALMDYASIVSDTTGSQEEEFKMYRPEVLTDDRSGSSLTPTIIKATVILALMAGGLLFLVNYMRQPAAPAAANTAAVSSPNPVGDTQPTPNAAQSNAPDMTTLKVEFKALNQAIMLGATNDGIEINKVVAAGATEMFEPKESLTINYNRWNADKVQLTVNGKQITLPSVPLTPNNKRIEFTINKDNLAQIWESGAISAEVPPAVADANTNAALPTTSATQAVVTPPRPTPAVKPTVVANRAPAANTAAKPAETPKTIIIPSASPGTKSANVKPQ